MQMFGIGALELIVILVLAVLVVGPDRVPSLAADLARWIRRTRVYANHLMRDFNEVIGDLEKEAGASREDWKEIASVVTRHTGDLGRELQKVTNTLEQAGDLSEAKAEPPPMDAAAPNTANGSNGSTAHEGQEQESSGEQPATAAPEEEKPWFVPERRSRLRNE